MTNAFQKILYRSGHNSKKIWVDEGSEFYNTSMKSWLQDNDTEIYSIDSEGAFVVAEGFIKVLKNKISNI